MFTPDSVFRCVNASNCGNDSMAQSYMQDAKVVIAGTLRDAETTISTIRPLVEKIGAMFKSFKVLIVVRRRFHRIKTFYSVFTSNQVTKIV
jgi:hypothetical protein